MGEARRWFVVVMAALVIAGLVAVARGRSNGGGDDSEEADLEVRDAVPDAASG